MNYNELVKSNWGFISDRHQEEIRNKRILLAGCGLGSNIATLAARTGFADFILADGDNVELSNLNRQAFRLEHIGSNKAKATADMIHEINPQAKIRIFPSFIKSSQDVTDLVSAADLIINMVDPGSVLFEINGTAYTQEKPVFFPLNIGFGSAILVFTPNSQSLSEMISETVSSDEFFLRLVEKLLPFLPEYIQEYTSIKETVLSEKRCLPQLGIASNLTAARTVTAMIQLIEGRPIKLAPCPVTLDCLQVNQATSRTMSK